MSAADYLSTLDSVGTALKWLETNTQVEHDFSGGVFVRKITTDVSEEQVDELLTYLRGIAPKVDEIADEVGYVFTIPTVTPAEGSVLTDEADLLDFRPEYDTTVTHKFADFARDLPSGKFDHHIQGEIGVLSALSEVREGVTQLGI